MKKGTQTGLASVKGSGNRSVTLSKLLWAKKKEERQGVRDLTRRRGRHGETNPQGKKNRRIPTKAVERMTKE